MKTIPKHSLRIIQLSVRKSILVFLTIVALGIFSTTLIGQTDTLKNQYENDFDSFKKNVQQEFDQFKNHNDSIFHQFLKESWTEFQLMQDVKSAIPKPKNQPVIEESSTKSKRIVPKQPKTMLQDTGKQIQYQMEPSSYGSNMSAKPYSTIDFYGSKVKVFKADVPTFDQNNISKLSIASFFEKAVKNDDLAFSIYDLVNKAKHSKLNGWGYLRLLQEASSTTTQSLNEQVLFAWTALLKTGYDVRVGFDKNDIYLFVNFDVPVFYKLYLSKGNQKYYLVPFKGQSKPSESIVSYKEDFPAELNQLSLIMNDLPQFTSKTKKRKVKYFDQSINLSYNNNLVNFYKTYPDCDLSLYFPPPLSEQALASLDDFFGSKFNSMNSVGKINLLLSFIQHGIAYESDDKQFGYENYLFAEESLYYPSVDCEDRTVLLSQMVEYFTGYKSIALAYPGHVTLAVNIPETVNGSYVMHKGDKYYVCDPTYIGAKCGMLMPEFEKESPEIIVY